MGHAAHFLQRLDRVTRSQTELALGLYRDHEAVKHVLARADLPESASRVALAIGDAQRGPFVIVTRDGRFVTCLGEGMSPGKWPVVPRAALDASLAHAADMRRRHQMAAAIARPFEDDIDILLRINQRKNMLSREEIVGISAFAPIFGHTLYQVLAKQSLELVNDAIGCRQPTKSGAEAHARTVWGCAYAMELCGTVEERALLSTTSEIGKVASFSMPLTYLMDHTFVLRGIWAAAKVGPALIDTYARRLEVARSLMKVTDSCLGLATIALRHPETRPAIVRILGDVIAKHDGSSLSELRAIGSTMALNVLESPAEIAASSRREGALAYAALAADAIEKGEPGYAARAEEVPADLAETAYLTTHGCVSTDVSTGFRHLFGAVPLLATVSVEAFHYPESSLRKLVSPWGEREVARHFGDMKSVDNRRRTVKYDARIERNDPCPCASGKKFKKCCRE